MSVSEIEDLILDEYQQDMGKEGLYFFALKRFGKAEKTLETDFPWLSNCKSAI
jgi:hypothetical protein